MPGYIPPHLRPGYKRTSPKKALTPKRRGVHFKSNVSGLRSMNERWHRFTVKIANISRSNRAKAQSKKLSVRKLRKTVLKGALKGTRKAIRKTKSLSPRRLQKKKFTVKSH